MSQAAAVEASSGRCRPMRCWLLRANGPGSRTRGCLGPPGAVLLMQAIDGDGSPWSYLSASILSREAAEFGARWPGLVWTGQTILSKPPRQTDDPDVSDDERKPTGDAPVANWTWRRTAPRIWEPTYAERGTTKKVVLHIRDPVGGDRIYQATDTYQAGSYDCKTRTTVLCTGEGGIDY